MIKLPSGIGREWKHWCPNGCGKKVVCTSKRIGNSKSPFIFICDKCKKAFIKVEGEFILYKPPK